MSVIEKLTEEDRPISFAPKKKLDPLALSFPVEEQMVHISHRGFFATFGTVISVKG